MKPVYQTPYHNVTEDEIPPVDHNSANTIGEQYVGISAIDPIIAKKLQEIENKQSDLKSMIGAFSQLNSTPAKLEQTI